MCGVEKDDTTEHALWKCTAKSMKEKRDEVLAKWTQKKIEELQNCTKLCGIITDDWRLDEAFAEIAMVEEEDDAPPQMIEGEDVLLS